MKKLCLLIGVVICHSVTAQIFFGTTGAINKGTTPQKFSLSVTTIDDKLESAFGLIRICVDLEHTSIGESQISLIAPDGTTVSLFRNYSAFGQKMTSTCFDESAATLVVRAESPMTGSFIPMENLGEVNNGQSAKGIWQLVINNMNDEESGTLKQWSIEFGGGASTPIKLHSTDLPLVVIDTRGQQIENYEKLDVDFKVIDHGASNQPEHPGNIYDGIAGIEVRGRFSSGFPQNSYGIELRTAAGAEVNASLLGMPAESDWILMNTYNDKAFARIPLAMALFQKLGHYASRGKFVEVIIDDNYRGIYLLMERIKRDKNRVDISKLEPTENSGNDLTGGYIFTSDYDNAHTWKLSYAPIDHPELDIYLNPEYPRPELITEAQKKYLREFVNVAEGALYGSNFQDPTNGFRKYFDTRSFIDYFIVNELARNVDGFKKSFYFHKDKDLPTMISPIKAGPVWDFDWAWKNIWSCEIFEQTDGSGWAHHINDCNNDFYSPGWHIRMLQDPAFGAELIERWKAARESSMSNEKLFAYIDSVARVLASPQERHFNRWRILGIQTGTFEVDDVPETFAGQVNQLKDWISKRTAWLDKNLSTLVRPANVGDQSVIYFDAQRKVLVIGDEIEVPVEISIINPTGQTIIHRTTNTAREFTLSHLKPGLYIVFVRGKHFQQAIRILL